jgi:hypothetical protein
VGGGGGVGDWGRWLLFGLGLFALSQLSLHAPWTDAWIGGVVVAVLAVVVAGFGVWVLWGKRS